MYVRCKRELAMLTFDLSHTEILKLKTAALVKKALNYGLILRFIQRTG